MSLSQDAHGSQSRIADSLMRLLEESEESEMIVFCTSLQSLQRLDVPCLRTNVMSKGRSTRSKHAASTLIHAGENDAKVKPVQKRSVVGTNTESLCW